MTVTDGQADGRTDRLYDCKCHTSLHSVAKNGVQWTKT